jgi:hypothetical protein
VADPPSGEIPSGISGGAAIVGAIPSRPAPSGASFVSPPQPTTNEANVTNVRLKNLLIKNSF